MTKSGTRGIVLWYVRYLRNPRYRVVAAISHTVAISRLPARHRVISRHRIVFRALSHSVSRYRDLFTLSHRYRDIAPSRNDALLCAISRFFPRYRAVVTISRHSRTIAPNRDIASFCAISRNFHDIVTARAPSHTTAPSRTFPRHRAHFTTSRHSRIIAHDRDIAILCAPSRFYARHRARFATSRHSRAIAPDRAIALLCAPSRAFCDIVPLARAIAPSIHQETMSCCETLPQGGNRARQLRARAGSCPFTKFCPPAASWKFDERNKE